MHGLNECEIYNRSPEGDDVHKCVLYEGYAESVCFFIFHLFFHLFRDAQHAICNTMYVPRVVCT